MPAIKVLCLIAAIATGASYFDSGRHSPCSILGEQVRHRDDLEAAIIPDAVVYIDSAGRYGPLSPARCIGALLGQRPILFLTTARPASQQQVQSPQPTTNEEIFRTVLKKTQPAINKCSLRRLRGELPTFAASAECSNRLLIAAFNAAHYKYMDLIKYLAAKRLEVAEQIDRGKLTEEQARQEAMKIMMQIIAAERERDSGVR